MKVLMTISLLAAAIALSGTALAESALIVSQPGRGPEKRLKVKSSKVPTFSLTDSKGGKIKAIPRLDIGEEPHLSAADLKPFVFSASNDVQLKPIQKHPSPDLIKLQTLPIPTATNAKAFTTPTALDKIPSVKELAVLPSPTIKESTPEVKKLDEMDSNDYKILQALILLEMHKKYELAMGLLAELLDDPKHHLEALYHYALTVKGLALNTEFREYMLRVAKESEKDQKNKQWKIKATEQLVANIDILETSDIQSIDPLVQQTELDVSTNDLYQLVRAKYYLNAGQLGPVQDSLILISDKSNYYNEALLVSSLFNYRRGKIDEAIMDLEKLLPLTQKSWPHRSVAAITLARMYFQKSQFKEAFQAYLQVDKSDPLWLQAMVEQAWTQILSEDFEGAAGNMFSLHTDFFKNAFSPESYVVRTVGYLNLCQFGDGMQVLTEMKKKYSPWKVKMEAYKASHRQTADYYDTIKSWMKNSDLKEVDGLPRSFIVELARHPGFIKVQSQINDYEDEIAKFNKITISLIRVEKEILQKQNEVIKTAKDAEERERQLEPLKTQQHIAKNSANSIKALRAKSITRIEKEKAQLRVEASLALSNHFKELHAALDKVLGQNEVLQYEIYSGAGEHIRYQMAGGDVNDKSREELKVQDGKSLHWKTKGEVWEDEVGHYRSSLKNVCPKEAVADTGR